MERLWREVNRIVVRAYRNLFYYLETEGLLDPLDDIDLFCLHKVFIPRVNNSLLEFKYQFNNHPIRTEHNQTPQQLFTSGILANPVHPGVMNIYEDILYGVEEEGPVPDLTTQSEDGVVIDVPRLPITITPRQEELLQEASQVTDTNFGITRYISVRELIRVWCE